MHGFILDSARAAPAPPAQLRRAEVSREAESELRNVDMARDSTVRNVQALKDETRKVHQTQAEVARLKQKASHYAAECQLLAEHALSLGRANAATDVRGQEEGGSGGKTYNAVNKIQIALRHTSNVRTHYLHHPNTP